MEPRSDTVAEEGAGGREVVCEYASRRVTLSAPTGWSALGSFILGLLLAFLAWWGAVWLMSRWPFPREVMGLLNWCVLPGVFILAQLVLPGFLYARRWHFDPAARVVTRSSMIFGISTRAQRVCGFGEVGKLSIRRRSGEEGLALELWIGDRAVWLPGSRGVLRKAPVVAAMLGKKKQGWDRHGSWT